MKISQKILPILFGCYPMIAFAEVSDKVQSIPSILLMGAVIGVGTFFLGRFRWWLNFLLLPILIVIIAESILLWHETAMREAIIHEQGLIYFGALGIQSFFMLTGAVVGIVYGYKRGNAKMGSE